MDKIHLSDAEWEIMNCLWEKPHLTINQLVNELKEKKNWDKHTIISLLNRIEKKGGVSYRRNGRAKEYYPLVLKTDIVLQETKKFLDRVYQGSLSLLVNSVLEGTDLSQSEIQELYQVIQDAEKKEARNK